MTFTEHNRIVAEHNVTVAEHNLTVVEHHVTVTEHNVAVTIKQFSVQSTRPEFGWWKLRVRNVVLSYVLRTPT